MLLAQLRLLLCVKLPQGCDCRMSPSGMASYHLSLLFFSSQPVISCHRHLESVNQNITQYFRFFCAACVRSEHKLGRLSSLQGRLAKFPDSNRQNMELCDSYDVSVHSAATLIRQ